MSTTVLGKLFRDLTALTNKGLMVWERVGPGVMNQLHAIAPPEAGAAAGLALKFPGSAEVLDPSVSIRRTDSAPWSVVSRAQLSSAGSELFTLYMAAQEQVAATTALSDATFRRLADELDDDWSMEMFLSEVSEQLDFGDSSLTSRTEAGHYHRNRRALRVGGKRFDVMLDFVLRVGGSKAAEQLELLSVDVTCEKTESSYAFELCEMGDETSDAHVALNVFGQFCLQRHAEARAHQIYHG